MLRASILKEAIVYKSSTDLKILLNQDGNLRRLDTDWKDPSAVADFVTKCTMEWGSAHLTNDAVLGMVNSLLLMYGAIDHADLARQGRAASQATVQHMFFDALDTEMEPGNQHEPDWKEPQNLDSAYDKLKHKLAHDIEAESGSDEDRSTLLKLINDPAFGEQTRARGLKRLIQYDAITRDEAERHYSKEFMEQAR